MKPSKILRRNAHHIVTVYCDGAHDNPHERFVIVQYGLMAVLPAADGRGGTAGHGGLWAALPAWEYGGKRGRAQRSSVALKGTDVVPEPTVEESRKLLRDPSSDMGTATVLRCAQCGYREKMSSAQNGFQNFALDRVARLFDPPPTPNVRMPLQLSESRSEVEVRALVGCARLLAQSHDTRSGSA